jgi:predicted alpha/beta-hydrolase family hydrolase
MTVSACVRVMVTVYPSDSATAGLVLAHGAGGGQQSSFMVRAARELAARGVAVATFDFPYMAAGRSVPDKGPVLEAAWRNAIDEVRARPEFASLPLFIGGKSMGGRIASQVAAAGVERVCGLLDGVTALRLVDRM